MPDIAFHTGLADKATYTCRLLRKAWRQGARVAVTGTPDALNRLDVLLWTFEQEEFVPHARVRANARPDPTQDDPEEDPREALVRRLLEHQKFKAAAELLHEKEIQRSAQWSRPDAVVNDVVGEAPEPEVEIDLFSLMAAFRQVLERVKARPKVMLPPEQIPIETRIQQLLVRLSTTEACGFEELFEDVQTRSGMVVTFLALLEMIRLKLVRVFQQANFGAIRVYKREQTDGAPKFEGMTHE